MDVHSGGNSLFPVGAEKPSKFPIKLSNFRQPPPSFALEKAVFSPFIDQNFRKFVIFHEGGGGGGGRPPPPHRDFRHWMYTCINTFFEQYILYLFT
jgi:hypothetical protein